MNRKCAILKTIASLVALLAMTGAALAQQSPARTRTLELFLRPNGFASRTVYVQPGLLRIIVNNRVGLKQMNIRLEAATTLPGTAAVREGRVFRSTGITWSEEVNLPPGEYVLRETTRDLYQCRIVVGAR